VRAIDLFAGWGGFSLGAEQAGLNVVWAANHWQLAVDAHAKNLPGTAHSCQDLNQANFYDVPDFDVLLASPACQGHSQASQPKRRVFHDQLRSTAWAVVAACDAKLPAAIVIENVVDFRRWRLYDAWCRALNDLGYQLEEHEVLASEHGVPQRRLRLFIVGVRASAPLGLKLERRPEVAARPIIERNVGSWKRVTDAPARVQERIAKGRRNHGERFFSQHVSNHPGVSLDEPLRTITTKDQWILVEGSKYRPLTVQEHARAMGFPDSYIFPTATRKDLIKGLGNAVCPPVARQILSTMKGAT